MMTDAHLTESERAQVVFCRMDGLQYPGGDPRSIGMREERQASDGLSQTDRPSMRAQARTSDLENLASWSGLLTEYSFAAFVPGR